MISSQIPMRRFENMTKDPKMIAAMLDSIKVVNVGCHDEIFPYVVPLSFGYEIKDDKLLIYLHCAREGHKVDLWNKNPHVALTFSEFFNHPDKLHKDCMHDFRSVMALGTISLIKRENNPGQHGTAVQCILQHNNRKSNQFSVPHYMFMAVYMVTCDWKDVVGKFENPIEKVKDVPYKDVYKIPVDNTPYDYEYFYHKKQYDSLAKGHDIVSFQNIPLLQHQTLTIKEDVFRLDFSWNFIDDSEPYDLDIAALLVNANGNIKRRYDMVFYNQRHSMNYSIVHNGDDILNELTGSESIIIKARDVSDHIENIIITLSAYKKDSPLEVLSKLQSLVIRVIDEQTSDLVYEYSIDVSELKGNATTLISLNRDESSWILCKKIKTFDSWQILEHSKTFGLFDWIE